MIKLKQYIILFGVTILGFLSPKNSFSQSEDELRAMYIINIAAGVTWENESAVSTYTIGVFSSEDAFIALKELAATRTIKKKPFEVILYKDYEEIKSNHIVYVSKNENAFLGFIYKELRGKNVLIISDRSHEPQYTVVNLNKEGNQKPFDINSALAKKQNLIFSPTILRLGGSREDIRVMHIQANKEVLRLQIVLDEKDSEIEELKKTIKNLNILIKEQAKRLEEFESKSN